LLSLTGASIRTTHYWQAVLATGVIVGRHLTPAPGLPVGATAVVVGLPTTQRWTLAEIMEIP
jgi:hypothetical protein